MPDEIVTEKMAVAELVGPSWPDCLALGCFVAVMELANEGTWANPNDWLAGSYTDEASLAGRADKMLTTHAKRGARLWLDRYGSDPAYDYQAAKVRKEFRL